MSTRSGWWRWLPRLLAIAYALFLSLFAFDSWEGVGFWEGLVGFLVLAVGFTLIFGWREAVVLAALAGPPVVVGVLFLLSGSGGAARARVA